MKIQCDYCNNTYEDTLPKCPSCGAPNPSHNDNDNKPRTIEELKKWYEDRKLPPENVTRFFIGKDYKGARAFGIYKDDNGDIIVYKNKADGSRAIRYKGKDEQYAVNELWQKLKDEIIHQKSRNVQRANSVRYTNDIGKQRARKGLITAFIIAWFFIIIASSLVALLETRHNGYYSYGESVYYLDSGSWYSYDDYYGSWYETTPPAQYDPSNLDPYFMGKDYNSASEWTYKDQEFTDVKDSTAYSDNHPSSSSDSDYDWDSNDSWDSGGTDWDSDW